jgi:hypothetical protein
MYMGKNKRIYFIDAVYWENWDVGRGVRLWCMEGTTASRASGPSKLD